MVRDYSTCRNLIETSLNYGKYLGNIGSQGLSSLDVALNTTLTLRNMSSMLGNCTSSVEGSQSTIIWYIAQFPSPIDYLLAWISNLGGNLINMVN